MPELFANATLVGFTATCSDRSGEKPCPMCTHEHSGKRFRDVEQRIAFAFVARSPIERIDRGWAISAAGPRYKVYSDMSGDYTCDYVTRPMPTCSGYSVFTRRDESSGHFWSGEMGAGHGRPRLVSAKRRA